MGLNCLQEFHCCGIKTDPAVVRLRCLCLAVVLSSSNCLYMYSDAVLAPV
uniref:Uncharacterized protein n=1 Tax=Arundo donax TaxID=35708 RepID=A0A0A9GT95_ARUDO